LTLGVDSLPRLNDEQLRQLYEERMDQISRSALKVFSRWGFHGTKMSMIAAEAGVSHGLLYNYYPSKDILFTSLVEQAVTASVHEIENLNSMPGTAFEKIKLFTEALLDKNGILGFMIIHQARNSADVPEKVRQLMIEHPMDVYVDLLHPLFKDGQNNGEIISGDLPSLISDYLTVLSGVMVLGEGYSIPNADVLLRIVAAQQLQPEPE
jgi:AcrR family transcriptional regulator